MSFWKGIKINNSLKMKKVKLRSIFTAIIIAVFSILFTSCKKSKSEPEPVVAVIKNNNAYIYKTDNTDAVAYKTMLEDNDCHVTLID
jgi:PBP1b-binding outer membrane lipoprotein LpoB